eukprot:CAMPEP_0118647340 /NCGR_PEP_ID=MMETSP0785-20121206/8551_1 /TAXON_ID=91992 /ORGANISM="Bolidomonas pacifica, Strain CCMP 1866" /LENGTH=587 /DNA_ID=CAMNT_0006539421 /DNA_START=37 /DNA_END=1796 /DNA_ORIENTATION=-
MPKTGWKFTKAQPAKNTSNQIKRSNASSQIGRKAPKEGNNMRSQDTIKRLKMYNNGKAIRNAEGKVVGGQFMMKDRAGDVKITASTGRVAPDRRWFGNTRVVGATELDKFREEMTTSAADPYSVVVARKKLPMGLLMDNDTSRNAAKAAKEGLLMNESFEQAFTGKVGGGARKRVKVDQLLVGREAQRKRKKGGKTTTEGEATVVENPYGDDTDPYSALLKVATTSNETYEKVNAEEGIVQWGRDSNIEKTSGEGVDWVHEKKNDLFLKGQSRRIWAELYKVLDCSDVVLHIIDARNVPGTKCDMIGQHLSHNAKHKHLIYVLNKIDLVPSWVAKRWVGELSKERPTVAFHASMTHAFGKGALISLLRQFGKLLSDKKQISVGVVGYPNVGKSSVINTLISKKSCKVAPVPGETKIWQYISLMKRIFLIDCPGVVVDSANDTEEDSVLKGVVRAERLPDPTEWIPAILRTVKRSYVAACYGLPEKGEGTWKDDTDLLEKICRKTGRLKKGGDPDTFVAAVQVINDFQRGRLPYYIPPPELKTDEGDDAAESEGADTAASTATIKGVKLKKQDLDLIGLDKGDGIGGL